MWKIVSVNVAILIIIASGIVVKPEIRFEGGIDGYVKMYFLEFNLIRCLIASIIFFLLWLTIESADYLARNKSKEL